MRKSAPVIKAKKPAVKSDEIVDAEDQHIGGGFQNEQEIHDALP